MKRGFHRHLKLLNLLNSDHHLLWSVLVEPKNKSAVVKWLWCFDPNQVFAVMNYFLPPPLLRVLVSPPPPPPTINGGGGGGVSGAKGLHCLHKTKREKRGFTTIKLEMEREREREGPEERQTRGGEGGKGWGGGGAEREREMSYELVLKHTNSSRLNNKTFSHHSAVP